ncbi:YdeI/OmpD-associated family protein [Cohnella silvisoli]|uniref:YdeI/OmpD-associated family protein n=1 Tax=Cohnella silvisoli TaxID=2873699 RepID=A0ABV1KYU6_9BACL|nr:YdeI/OmpD-associated family protein [Cohnella silvisoli]
MESRTFKGPLLRPPGVGTWIYVDVPFDAESIFGSKGQVRVRGTVNGAVFRSTLMPRGDGTHYLVVGGELREAAGVSVGDEVMVNLSADTDERIVEAPDDLQAELAVHEAANRFWAALAYSYRKEYVNWIEDAKREATWHSRIAKAVQMLAEGKKLKS